MTIAPSAKNRKGRKRKSGRRTAAGALVRVRVDYREMATDWPCRRGLPEALRASERAGSYLGRLRLRKLISEPEFESGQRYAVIVGAYRAMIGVPGHLVGVGKGYDCAGAKDCPPETCVCRARQERYDAAYCAIRTHAAHMAVNAVAIHDHDISPDQIVHLREGLAALARHFGLTGKGKSRHA